MGLDESYEDLIETRVIMAPDGLDYVVPLHPYYWTSLAAMEADGFTSLSEVISIAWRGRQANVEKGLRSDFTFCMNVAIDEMHEHYRTRIRGHSND